MASKHVSSFWSSQCFELSSREAKLSREVTPPCFSIVLECLYCSLHLLAWIYLPGLVLYLLSEQPALESSIPRNTQRRETHCTSSSITKIVPDRHVHFKTIKAHEHIATLKQKMAVTNGMCYEANCLFRVNAEIGNWWGREGQDKQRGKSKSKAKSMKGQRGRVEKKAMVKSFARRERL